MRIDRRPAERAGFTIVELLVALSIIALLLAITIPAIQSARESSRRMQCQSRLKEFGNALHGFEATHRRFPAAQPASIKAPFVMSWQFYAPHVYLLPYFEQRPVADQFDLRQPQYYVWDPESLSEPARTAVVSFLCPSDSGTTGNNYRFCIGTGPSAVNSSLTPEGADGAFEALVDHSAADIRDGLSHTLAVSEKLRSDADVSRYSREDYWYSGLIDLLGRMPSRDELISVCATLTTDPPKFQPRAGGTWYIADFGYTWYNHAVGPNSAVPDCSCQSFTPNSGAGPGVYKASSRHSGGVNSLFMDGHVTFISDKVDLRVWRALATRAGGDPVSDADF